MEASYYQVLDQDRVRCDLCPVACVLAPGQCGVCRVRCHEKGRLVITSYGRFSGLTTESLDKIPVRFHPELSPQDKVLSFGNVGCNLHCVYCRNHQLSQGRFPTEKVSVDELVQRVKNLSTKGVVGICFTYNEPGIAPEFNGEVAKAIKAAGFATVLDTNAYLNPGPFLDFIEPMDILSIDLKGFDDSFYQSYCKGHFQPVWDNILAASQTDKHVEITMTILSGANDRKKAFDKTLRALAKAAPELSINLAPVEPHHQVTKKDIPSAATMVEFKKIAEGYFDHVSMTEPADD